MRTDFQEARKLSRSCATASLPLNVRQRDVGDGSFLMGGLIDAQFLIRAALALVQQCGERQVTGFNGLLQFAE